MSGKQRSQSLLSLLFKYLQTDFNQFICLLSTCMPKIILFLSVFAFFFTGFKTGIQPPLPYTVKNVCPGEYCSFGKWKTKAKIKVFTGEGKTDTVFSLKKDETFTAVKGNMRILKTGLLMVNEDHLNFKKGDKVYILCATSEGYFHIWYKGKNMLEQLSDFLGEPYVFRPKNEKPKGTLKNRPVTEWWVFIKTKTGKQGWINATTDEKKINFVSFKK
jgi:hypothetical protein